MIDIIEVSRYAKQNFYTNGNIELIGYDFLVVFKLFSEITCSIGFFVEAEYLDIDVKKHIENILINNYQTTLQLEGKPSNLKTK